MATVFVITAGPCHFDFFGSLSEGDAEHRKKVRFELLRESDPRAVYHIDMTIDGAGREDGSGFRWNLKGEHWPETVNPTPVKLTGWYDTKRRVGRLVRKD
ncbi:MAG: hypothetical protein PHI63_04050 [Patescibacteria group bacterium]|nr:hypothetical protein [Patescibacteria group bacterium]